MVIKNRVTIICSIVVLLSSAFVLSGCEDQKPIPMKMTDKGLVPDIQGGVVVPTSFQPNTLAPLKTESSSSSNAAWKRHTDALTEDASKSSISSAKIPRAMPGSQDVLSAGIRKAEAYSGLGNQGSTGNAAFRTKNWYWLRGFVHDGAVKVSINGKDVGKYRSMLDSEITDHLIPGSNSIRFTPEPTSIDRPVKAKIVVVYSQQPAGSPPVLIYDTTKSQSPQSKEAASDMASADNDTPQAPQLYAKRSPRSSSEASTIKLVAQ